MLPKDAKLPDVPLRKGEEWDDDTVFYRQVKEYWRRHRAGRLAEANEFLEQSEIPWLKHTPYHWSTGILGEGRLRVQMYPSGSKWIWKGKTFRGTIKNCEQWIRARIREMEPPSETETESEAETHPQQQADASQDQDGQGRQSQSDGVGGTGTDRQKDAGGLSAESQLRQDSGDAREGESSKRGEPPKHGAAGFWRDRLTPEATIHDGGQRPELGSSAYTEGGDNQGSVWPEDSEEG